MFTPWIQSTVWITWPCQQIHTVDSIHGVNCVPLLANSHRGFNPRCELHAPASRFTPWIQSTVRITWPCQQIHTVDSIHGVNCVPLPANSHRGFNPRCELRAPASRFTPWILSTVWITWPCQQIHTVGSIHGVNCVPLPANSRRGFNPRCELRALDSRFTPWILSTVWIITRGWVHASP